MPNLRAYSGGPIRYAEQWNLIGENGIGFDLTSDQIPGELDILVRLADGPVEVAGPVSLDSHAPLTLDVGLSDGIARDRGISNMNVYNTTLAAAHKLYTAEPSPVVSSAVLGAQVVVDYDGVGTRGCDFAAIDGEANCITDGTPDWWGTAIALRGQGQISGGVTHGNTRAMLAEARQAFDGFFTDVPLVAGEVTVVLPLGQTTDAMKVRFDAGQTIWIGDTNSDVIPDGTTVVAIADDHRTFTLSAPPDYTIPEKLFWTRSDGVLLAAEIGVLNYASTTRDVGPPTLDVWTKQGIALTNRGTYPIAAFIANHVNKVSAYYGIHFQQIADDFLRFLMPGRPGCTGMRIDSDALAFDSTVTNAGSPTLTRTSDDFDTGPNGRVRIGMRVWGPGIPGNTVVTGVADDYTSVTLSRNALATSAGTTIRFTKWTAGVLLPDQIPVQGLAPDGVTKRDLIKMDGNTVRLGDPDSPVVLPNNLSLRGASADGLTSYPMIRLSPGGDIVVGANDLTTQRIVVVTTAAGGVRFGNSAGAGIFTGAGSPEGVLTAPVSSQYWRSDGGAGSSLYIKESGAGNTGWVAK